MDNLVKLVSEENKQLVMITHSEQIAQEFSNAIIRLKDGRVVEAYHE
jgi:putative ABC transport system ATP-binding protein